MTISIPATRPAAAFAQTGTITGKVVEKDGEPIQGASVYVLGRGGPAALTRADGAFVIERVPVGTYTLGVSITGHHPQKRIVQVDANRATSIDFTLEQRISRLGVVNVRGNKVMSIDTTTAQARHFVDREIYRALPLESPKEALEFKAGVTSQGGELHFRGGRGDEVLTLVNGIPSRNALTSESVDLGLLAVSETEAVLGGMDAQYGNALSGIIAYTTREGMDKFAGEIRYFTDRYGESDKAFNNYERLSLGVGGPFALPNTKYFLALEGTFSDTYLKSTAGRKEHRLLDFIRLGNRQSNQTNVSSKVTFNVSPDAKLNAEVILNRSSRGRFHNRWNREGFVQQSYDSTSPTDGSIATRYGTWAYYQIDGTYLPSNTAEHLPITEDAYSQLALTWRQTLSPGTLYNIRASRQRWDSEEDVLDRQLWEYQQQPNQYYDAANRIEGPYYVTNGDYPSYEKKTTVTYTVNGDLTKKVGDHNLMAGGEFNYNSLQFLHTEFPNVMDVNGNYGATRDEFQVFNPEGSVFAQDRWSYEGMVMNAGIRYDNFSVGDQIASSEVRDPVKTQWSPRVGFAYPISDRDVMSFHYGRIFQVPDHLNVYQGRNISAQARGNPDLEPQTTIAYQLGMQHLFSREIKAQFGVYFKDIYGLLTTVEQQIPGFALTVPTYVNRDYASSRGIEFTLIKDRSHGFAGELNYTYSNSTGTASDPNRALPTAGNVRDQFKPTSEQPLNWDQRHSFSATLRLGNEKDWAASFVYQFGTGFPYTRQERQQRVQDPSLTNASRLPSTSTLSAQGERIFRVWGEELTFYVQATNLLDAKNIVALQPDLWPQNQVDAQSYR
ncbi:MAG TPA: TonB-dependent receptor, partial [Candidatus Eisenbacteria bacterium]|nr:TonB-dependent receptor [Candidatus Eisenbacteria bacterium]